MTVRARIFGIHTAAAALLCLAVLSGMWVTHAQEKKKLSIYSSRASFSVAVRDVDGKEYVALSEVLQPLGGTVSHEGSKIKLRLAGGSGECEEGKTRCKLGGNNIELAAKITVQDGTALAPLHSLPFVLTGLMDTKFDFHENSRRMFLGNYGNTFKAEGKKSDTPSVAFEFSAPVNPSISTEPGKLRMVFSGDGINSGIEQFKFDTDAIPNATYSEHNGEAEIVVSGTRPLMAEFSDGGKTVTVKTAPEQAKAAVPAEQATTPAAAESAPSPAPTTVESSSQTTPVTPTQPLFSGRGGHYLVVIDASHGGDEVGATLSDELTEKEVTLSLARRLRNELQARGVPTLMLRDNDATMSVDDRAAAANAARPTLYIAVHAGSMGHGIRVYTSVLNGNENTERYPGAGVKVKAGFLPWETAQAGSVDNSRIIAASVSEQLNQSKIHASWSPAPVRPLNNIASPAIALEIAPPDSKRDDVSYLANPAYQQSVAIGVATALVNARGKYEENR
jgi:N-acetylmuramoyl-L-alanine amidase